MTPPLNQLLKPEHCGVIPGSSFSLQTHILSVNSVSTIFSWDCVCFCLLAKSVRPSVSRLTCGLGHAPSLWRGPGSSSDQDGQAGLGYAVQSPRGLGASELVGLGLAFQPGHGRLCRANEGSLTLPIGHLSVHQSRKQLTSLQRKPSPWDARRAAFRACFWPVAGPESSPSSHWVWNVFLSLGCLWLTESHRAVSLGVSR